MPPADPDAAVRGGDTAVGEPFRRSTFDAAVVDQVGTSRHRAADRDAAGLPGDGGVEGGTPERLPDGGIATTDSGVRVGRQPRDGGHGGDGGHGWDCLLYTSPEPTRRTPISY